jgi:Rps23 Pro-64 3,4-dihydroxylase Tpa1-like proline 4-hydroxylase
MIQEFAFDRAAIDPKPFLHFFAPSFIHNMLADRLLTWLEHDASWFPKNIQGFYESYDISLRNYVLPEELAFLTNEEFLGDVRSKVGDLMHARLGSKIDITAHKLISGQHIGIHSDFGTFKQTHRLLVQLNRGWSSDKGGILMLLHEERPSDLTSCDRLFLPDHRSAVCFEISPRSFHAVSTVNNGDRYTLCISFYGED